ncbi:WD_REPEATS_REGION domain-containing protein [Mortierella hygrophila]|uniref:WD_REPEATS_REGION domain-containing protein n=1 Tax=Mortierella hygrophila TaxID=979708 RepID=A0A9P6K371_9FUNG|nr:WD_REPEATS_REGION domain-containing protein [Mortierella hygrophila]
MSKETHSASLWSLHNSQSTKTLRSTTSQSTTNSAFASIGRAANKAVQSSSTVNDRSIGHGFAAILVKGKLIPSDLASGDADDGDDNKSVSSQRVRKRDKLFGFFTCFTRDKQAQSPKTSVSRPSTVNTQYNGDIECEVEVSGTANSEHVVSTAEVKSLASKAEPSALSAIPRLDVFLKNINPPVALIALPNFGSRIDTTPQLALCLGLLSNSVITIDQQENPLQVLWSSTAAHLAWLQAMKQDPVEQEHLRSLGDCMVDEFAKDASKDSTEIAEMVLIGPVLDNGHFRRLLSCTIAAFDHAVLLDVDLLQGLVQLVQSAPSEALLPDDLVKILRILRVRLQDTHQQSSVHPFHLTLALSRLLDVMAEHKVKDLDRVKEHEPLSGVLSGLKASSDPYLMYQACYAFQALQYVPNNESPLQAVLRHSTGVVDGLVKVSAVFKLDLGTVLEGLGKLQETLGTAVEVASSVYDGASSLMESGRGVLESMKEGLGSGQKRLWYTAVRAAYAFAQAGQLKDLNVLIYKAPCRHDPLFQWGICQLLGEIASDTIWDTSVRLQAIDLLGDLYKNDPLWGQDESVRTWMLNIIRQLGTTADQVVSISAHTLLKDLDQDQNTAPHLPYPLRNRLPLPATSPTLARVQNIIPLEYDLHKHKVLRLEQSRLSLYIQPFAKASLGAKDEDTFPLLEKVLEFLASERQVMLILGDSGSGKSTFNRHLEHQLWTDYKQGGRIPLFINLPAIDRPDQDMIAKQLIANNFSDDQIQEMKQHRQFILICDGYDESQQLVNLHRTNMLNQPGQWDTKMVISCRTQFLGPSYIGGFRPLPTDRYASGSKDLFQEAVIAPFSKEQIEKYIKLYVQDPQTALLFQDQAVWSEKKYMDKLTTIPNIKDLVKNPFLLTLALEALPRMVASNNDLSSIRVTRVGLYDMFVEQWLETNLLRLHMSALSKEELTAFKSLVEGDFIVCGINYLLRLSAEIFLEQGGNPVVRYTHIHDKNTWKAAFFGTDPGVKLLREASPLMRTGDQYRFVHRSMLEYFLSRVIYNPAKVDERDFDSAVEIASPVSLSSDTNGPLFQRNLLKEPSIIQFLCDRVRLHPDFEQHLLSVIYQSKTDSSVIIAAANAITILVRAGALFNGADLRGIKIPSADLSYGQFDSAQFQGADLTGVNFSGSWLRQADLSHAQLKGVQFGELPYLKAEGEVKACAYSPDGRMLGVALRGEGLGIGIYNTSTWERIHLITATEYVVSIAFSPDSRRIVSGDEDGMVQLWDSTSGEELLVMKGHTDWIRSLTYSPCGNHIASASDDKTVRLWDSETGVCIFVLKGHTEWVASVRFSPNGRQLVSSSEDGTIRLWDSETGDAGVVLSPSLGKIYSLAYSPDGRWIASGHKDGNVRLWDMVSGSPGPVLQVHTDSVTGIAFSPNSQLIATSSDDHRVMLWDASTGDHISTFDGHSRSVCDVAFSPDGLTIASGSNDRTLRLWEANSSRSRIAIQAQIGDSFYAAYSPDGLSVLSIDCLPTLTMSLPGVIRQGDATTGLRGSVSFELQDQESIRSLDFSADGDQVATGSRDGAVRLWGLSTGAAGPVLEGHSSPVKILVYSTCGRWIASSDKYVVRLWDLYDTEQRYVLVEGGEGYGNKISDLKFPPTGHQLAVSSRDGRVRLFDPRTRVLLTSKKLMEGPILALGYSPNSQQLALGTNTSITLWDLQSDEPSLEMNVAVSSVDSHRDGVTIAYSPCGQFLASTFGDCIVHLWRRRSAEGDIESWSYKLALRGCHGFVTSLSWNPVVPKEFITASYDGAVRVWRVSSDDGAVAVTMRWGTNLRKLCTADVVLEGVTGLSPTHQELISQRRDFDHGISRDDGGSDDELEDDGGSDKEE